MNYFYQLLSKFDNEMLLFGLSKIDLICVFAEVL